MSFQCWSVFAIYECVDIKRKWYTSITQFKYSFHWIKTASHTNLVNAFSKRTHI